MSNFLKIQFLFERFLNYCLIQFASTLTPALTKIFKTGHLFSTAAFKAASFSSVSDVSMYTVYLTV